MKRLLLAAAAAVAVAAPAAARDNSAYFGLEAGPLWAKDTNVEVDGEDLFDIEHKMGIDGDMIAGYDFGMFRLEAELAYKRSEHDEYSDDGESFDGDGRTSVYSGMINGMVDVGPDHDYAFYAGAGIGLAQVTHVVEEGEVDDGLKLQDRGMAWQLFAGVRKSVSQYFEIGAKYRYFNAGSVEDEIEGLDVEADYKSHSVLISLIHSFAARPRPVPPAPIVPLPPAPPPPPPATQTCPDGSVVLASEPCPLPPPPPPPPAPEPIRG